MKIGAIISSIIGALGALFLGMKWTSDLKAAASIEGVPELTKLKTAATLLILCAVIGIVSTVLLVLKKAPNSILGIALIIAGILPMFFSGKALFGIPMALGGILAFRMKDE